MIENQEQVINAYADDFIKYMKQDLAHIAETYMRICFRLYEADKNKYYSSLGYPDIYSCAEAELDISKSTVSRMINICKRFSRLNGYRPSMFIADKYKKYNFSQLVEMVSLKDEDLKLINSDMSVKDIRDVKKKIRRKFNDTLKESTYQNLKNLVKTGLEKKDPSVATSQQEFTGFEGSFEEKIEEKEEYESNEIDKGCDYLPDVEVVSKITKKDIEDLIKDFQETGYHWLNFPGIDLSYYRLDVGDTAFIICYDTSSIDGLSIESYHIFYIGDKKCFDDDATVVSKKDFIQNLLMEAEDLNEAGAL